MNKAQEKQWQRVYDLVAEIDHTFSQIDTSRISENQLSEFGVAGRILQSIGICKHLLKLVAEQQLWYKTTTSVLEKKSFTFRKD